MFMKNYIRNILIFVVTFSLIFGLCITPSFADTYPSVTYYSSIPTSSDIISTGYQCTTYIANRYIYIGASTPYNVFFTVDANYKLCIAANEIFDMYYLDTDSGSVNTATSVYYDNYYIYSTNETVRAKISNEDVPHFTSLDVALAEIGTYIPVAPPDDPSYNAYFDIPCGNVAYIKTGNDNTLTLSCTMPEFSKLTGSTGTYWTNTMEIAYGVPSYPSTGTTFPLSSMSDIQWFRSTEGRDLLGRTKKALFLDTTQSSDNFIVIYNPTYRELTMSGQGDINPTIRVQCSALVDYHMYSLTGEYNSQGTISSYSIDGFSDPYVGTPTSDNENVQGTNSTGATPNIGGSGNEIGGTGGIIEYVQGIQNTLDNFANSFISLLKAPISHIQSLISSGTDYFNVIRGLYGWLPDEVQGTINSAMIVSISIGVIALLL